MNRTRTVVLASSGLALALALAGCSGTNTGSQASDESALQTVSVGVHPVSVAAAFQYGIDEDIWADYGLEIDLHTGQGGAAALPAVSSGSLDIALGNPLSVMVAADQGLDMRIISGYAVPPLENDLTNGVVVESTSGIETWSDLEGKTVAVNALNTQGDLTIKEAVASDGGDSSLVNFTELGFPDMAAQLELGNVDAIWAPEPFLSPHLSDDTKHNLGSPNEAVISLLPPVITFTSGSFADENAALLETFENGLADVLEQASADDEGFTAAIAEYMSMPVEVVESITIDELTTEMDADALTSLGSLATEYDYIDQDPSFDTLVID